MDFKRKQTIEANISPKRALIIYGPRRVGKTTLLEQYLETQHNKKIFFATGDDFNLREVFSSEIRSRILDIAKPYDIVAIDEAQGIPSIGLGAKMIVDAFPEKQLILTGSSSFDLSKQIGEPLTGRHFTLTLLPLAQTEMQASRFELESSLEDFLIYGNYPEVLLESDKQRKVKILNELVSSYLFKDVLALDKIKSSSILLNIVQCLAFQIGGEVSLNEISRTVGADVKTVARYLDVLEKMFVIKKVLGFSRNLRNEISKKSKYYFLDNGVRNAVISQFNGLSLRNDVGQLWENFIFMELVKQSIFIDSLDHFYFWRTHTGTEIDIIKESNGKIFAYECKWSGGKATPPNLWRATYPNASFQIVNRENYLDLLL